MTDIYRVGERVDGLYDENTDDMWYPGRIRCVHLSEDNDSADSPTFEVLYDDGEVEMHVRPEFLRQHVPGTICVGTRVLCRYDGGEEFYPGQVSDVQENGMYTIAYDDGEVEEDVPPVHIMEPQEDEGAEAAGKDEEPSETTDDVPTQEMQQQEDAEMEDVQDSPTNSADDTGGATDMYQGSDEGENGENKFDEPVATEPLKNVEQPRAQEFNDDEGPQRALQNEKHQEPTPGGVSAERAYIVESLELLEKRLGDAASTKSVLSTLVKQMRAYPQITADAVRERGGERLIIDSLKFHQAHAVIQCYGFVLLRRLCFLCVKSTHYLLRNGIVELVIQAMNAFVEDAILQASACGALAVFTRVHAGLNNLIEYQVAQLVLSTLIYHKTYSVHTRQVHYYACEVLLELCELDDLQTLNLLCGEQEEDFTGDMSPVSLLLFLLRQGLSLDDKKACCAVGSLLMCLAASGRRAAALILSLNGLAELSTVMARYPTEPSIQKYSTTASKQIALCSVRQSPTKRIKDTATEILRETESFENSPRDRQPPKRSAPRGRSTNIGKRKSNPTVGYGSPAHPRGAANTTGTPYRNGQGFSKVSSPFGQGTPGFGSETNSFGYPARNYPASSTAPQQPSSLVILDGSLGMDSGFGSTNKRKQISKEDRQSELFDAYGIQGISNSANGRPYGTKRAQLKAHLASAESTWATPQQHEMFQGSSSKPYSSRSEHLDQGPAYSHRDFMPRKQNRWEYGDDEPQNLDCDPDMRQNRGAKRKKKTPGTGTMFQVRVENDNQLRVSRETRPPYPSPQRLGAATKRAAKARQKRITGGAHSSLIGRPNNTSSESLNDYATQLFQDNAARAGTGILTNSKLTPREKEEIRERERLSFAEKLHKMIDKAKSTLANSNTAPVDDAVRPQKMAATSKVVRKTREPPPDEKRPLSKKTRPVVSSTPKNVSKESSSPREAKPTSGLSKRQTAAVDAGAQQPVVPRAKPFASRSVVTPQGATDSKPRVATKSSRAATPKIVGEYDAEKDKVFAESEPGEVASTSAIAIKEPHEEEPRAVASEVAVPAQSTEELTSPSETISAEGVEPTSEAVQVEAGAVSVDVNAPPESQAEAGPRSEDGDAVPHNGENASQVRDKDAGEKEAVEGEVVAHSEDVAPSIEQDPAPKIDITAEAAMELSNPSVDTVQPSVSLLEEPSGTPKSADGQPSGASTIADAMYGDDYNEFDDNGGDDEDMTMEAGVDTYDAHTPATGTSEPATDVPLHESKRGEALYDDGYNEFDDDEATDETEAEGAPASEAIDNQGTKGSGEISSRTTEEVSAPAANAFETEAEHLVVQGDSPPVRAAEEADSVPTEGVEGKESLEPDTNVDEQSANAGVEAPETDHVVVEPEESQEPQSAVVDDDCSSHVDAPQTITEREPDEGTATSVDGNSVTEVNDSTEPENGAHVGPVDSAVDEDADGAPTLDNGADVPGGEKVDDAYEHETASKAEIDVAAPAIEPTETEGAVEVPGLSIQPVDLDGEVQSADTPHEAVDSNHSVTTNGFSRPSKAQEDSPDDAKEATQPEEALVASDSSSLPEQCNDDSKKLAPDSSDASIQSAAYDEENFDDEESHHQVEPNEAVASPVVPPVEEVVDQQLLQADTSDIAEAPAAAMTSDGVEEVGSKGLVANSSELSVQSAAYDDDDFDDGAEEESPHEKNADNTEVDDQEHGEHQPSAVEGTGDIETNLQSDPGAPVDDAPRGVEEGKAQGAMVDGEVPNPVSGSNEDGGFNGTIQDDAPCEVATELMVAKATQESPEQQQLEHSDSTSDTESTPLPITMEREESKESVQVAVANEAEKNADDLRVDAAADEVALENANSPAAPATATENPVESSVTTQSFIDPSAERDAPESEAPEIAIPTDAPAQEEALASVQSATYGDDEFDNGGEEEQATPSATLDSSPLEEERTNDSQNGELNTQASSEQTSVEAEKSAFEEVGSTDDPVATSEALSAPDQAKSPSTADDSNAGSSVDEGTDPRSEQALSEAELQLSTPDKQPDDQGGSTVPDENPSPKLYPSIPSVEVPPQPTDSIELDGTESAVTASSDETEVNAVDITPNTEAAEMLDYTRDGAFSEHPFESDPDKSSKVLSDPTPAEISVEPSTDPTGEETQYGDAEFDDVENDAAAEKNEVSENEIAQSVGEEISPAGNSSAGDLPSAEIDQAEGKAAEVTDDTEATASPATGMQEKEDRPELPETVVDTSGHADVVVDKGDAAIEIGDISDHADQNASSMTEGEVQDAGSSPDDTAYDEDFPTESPETQDAVVGEAASPGEEEIFSNGNTVAEADSPEVAENEPDLPDASIDGSAQASSGSDTAHIPPSKEEQYDDENDCDITVDATPPTEAGTDVSANNNVPENNAVAGASNDSATSENEQLNEDRSGSEEVEPTTADNGMQKENEAKAEESDGGDSVRAGSAITVAEPEVAESDIVGYEGMKTETVEPEVVEPKATALESVETEATESKPVEPEAVEPSVVELKSAESDVVEPGVVQSELAESKAVEQKSAETEAVNSEVVVSGTVDLDVKEAVELETGEPTSVGLETKYSEGEAIEVPTPETVVSEIGEPEALESPSTGPVPEEPVVSEGSQEEPRAEPLEARSWADPVAVEDEGLPSEPAVEVIVDATDSSGSPVIADNPSDTIESASPGPAPVVSENVPAAEELSEASNVDAGDGTDVIDEVAKDETTDIEDKPVRLETATSESTEPIASTPEETKPPVGEQASVQDDYGDVDPPADESVVATNDSAHAEPDKADVVDPSNQDVANTSTDTPREESVVQELAIKVDPPQLDEVAVENAATPAAASEGPKTEDQYDDDDGYNDFDDQDNGSPVPAAEPTIEAPVLTAATEAPATDDEYEDYENEDYGEDEKPVEAPIPKPVVQPSSVPPTSAREEEIEEVADEPEQAEEEAYADDQDEYNNEYEEDETPAPAPASKSASPTKDSPILPAEASADEYEDDNEEEYAEDEIEEASPRPAAKAVPQPAASSSDVEMDEEVGYDSDYAESDG
ncbi:hypothetical protein KRP22_012987 [Phytophthora ramorum]|nr:hypothetical protein KRP22_8581 [Phytophthora ramorum]